MYSIEEGNKFRQHIATKLRLLIESKGTYQNAVAKKANIDHATLSLICCGKRTPDLFTITKIVKTFDNVSLDYFIDGFEFGGK
jgi:transcriptional regulator with XRE-family HTH domain